MDFISTLLHQQSRRIGVIVPSVVVSEVHTDSMTITEHPVERPTSSGSGVMADYAYRQPAQVVMDIGIAGGGSLLDLLDTRHYGVSIPGSSMSPKDVYAALLKMQHERELLDVVTGKRKYSNMLIQSMAVTTDQTKENVLSAKLTLREVIITQTKGLQAAGKNDMALGTTTSAVINSGTKTPVPVKQPPAGGA